MIRKEIGKIRNIYFGYGGYQEAMIGITIDLGGKDWGVGDFKGMWSMERHGSEKWTDQDRIQILGEIVMWANQLMKDAHVTTLNDLIDIPVEVTFEGQSLDSWRILTEVI